MADSHQDRTGWFLIEMFALGAILHGFDVMTGTGLQTAILWWILGGIVAVAGWRWDKTKVLLGLDEEKVKRVTSDFRWWVASAIALFVLPMMSRYIDSAYTIYSRVGDPPSAILNLTDAKRWRFVDSFHDMPRILPAGTFSACDARVKTKDSKSASKLTDELLSLIQAGMWENSGAGGPQSQNIANGITLLVASRRHDNTHFAFECATRLAGWINEHTSIKAKLLTDQTTPVLQQCSDQGHDCVEIHVGDAE